VLVGNFGLGDAAPVELRLSGLPWANATVEVVAERIAQVGPATVSTTAINPEPEPAVVLPITGGKVTVSLPLVRSGDAWGLVIPPR
jgi:hypothetical protein